MAVSDSILIPVAKKKRIRGPLAERLWSRVELKGPNDCWPWQGATNNQGYGSLWNGVDRHIGAHVAAYELTNGPIPEGMHACHTCDNPPCCNPAHIFPGTRKVNMQDCADKGRNGSQRHPESRPRGDAHWTRTNPDRLARGERKPGLYQKLTKDDVLSIRRLIEVEGASRKYVAEKFRINRGTVTKIILRERWAWLED